MNYTEIDKVNMLRLILHESVYSNSIYIDKIIEYARMRCDFVANYTFSNEKRSIEIRVKKSNLKKDSAFRHSSEYYYSIISDAMLSLLKDPEIKTILYPYLHSDIGLKTIYNDIIDNKLPITLIYNTAAILDNIIYIYL